MMKFFSIAIPTWEINGKGVEYLDYSLNIIAHQTFKDYEVVISDHSVNDDIENLCKEWSNVLDIKYYRNEVGRGLIAPNANNTIRKSKGKYIKMLFQDDFLYDIDSLQKTYDYIENNKHLAWIVTGCAHTDDGENLHSPMIPRYNHNIHIGYNTISCPTVLTIKNEDPLLFDESLNWLVDVEYYKRLYLKYGYPGIVESICAINRNGEVRTTNMITETRKQKEVEKVTAMYKNNKFLDLSRVTLITVTSVRIEEHVKALEYSSRYIKFGAVKIVSDVKPQNLPNHIIHEYADPMKNIDDWNHFMVYKLGQFVDTEYAMIIHDDGFVINPESWKNEFYEYDYIGAPWPIPKDNFSYRDVNGELIRVGNSVSLRSKKLMDLASKLNLEWKPFHGYYSEDGFITVNNRHVYKEHGCKFANIDIAKYFSHESDIPEIRGIEPFAFHGKYSPYRNLLK